MLFKKLYQMGDKLEDKVRGKLSHYPIIYAFIGGAGIIIFWRGIWHIVDFLMEYIQTNGHPVELVWWDGVLSVSFGVTLLLLVGLFVTSFIGNEIIISGLKGEKKMAEKTEQDIELDISLDTKAQLEMKQIHEHLEKIQKILENKK